ncbi:MAG: glycosyltransferase, partial [Pseudomonadota bacterium]|nr:glycosyltransferase [Pseudomonadota bacterium]
MTTELLSILQINTSDQGGGAERVARDFHNQYSVRNHDSLFLVGRKKSETSNVIEIPQTRWRAFWVALPKFADDISNNNLGKYLKPITNRLADPFHYYAKVLGYENYHFPVSRKLVDKLINKVDVVHFHNLHGDYFDLRYLPKLSLNQPTLITLHDEYLYTGHCAYTLGCDRWKIGCGNCPHLDVYPAIRRDATRHNWRVKRRILTKSNITLVTPSQWLASRVRQSFLKDKEVHVIPNGVDQSIFKPGEKYKAREELDLPKDAFILLYAASRGRKSDFKDYEMLDRVVENLSKYETKKPIVFLALGGDKYSRKTIGNNILIETPYIKEQSQVVKYYQACD